VDDSDRISRPAAIDWLTQDFELSVGAAEAALDAAIDSGNVRIEVPNVILSKTGATSLLDLQWLFDAPISFADLRWQIRQQLGAPILSPAGTHAPGSSEEALGRSAPDVAARPLGIWIAEPDAKRDGGSNAPAEGAVPRIEAIRAALSHGDRPGTNISWDIFHTKILNACGVKDTVRGFGGRQIQRVVKKELSQIV
jgi:hypothetical protein